MTQRWQPYREPLWVTLRRTILIALVLGAALAHFRRDLGYPMATLLAMWISFGGHWVEIFYLNCLRPGIPDERAALIIARIAVWFVGGSILATGMRVTANAFSAPAGQLAWWAGGIGFIGIELVTHLMLQMRGAASFYNGRG